MILAIEPVTRLTTFVLWRAVALALTRLRLRGALSSLERVDEAVRAGTSRETDACAGQ